MKKSNSKIGQIVILLLAIFFLSLAIVFFAENQEILAIAFCAFFGLGFLYVFIIETIYHKKKKEIISENEIPSQTEIKRSLENFLLYFFGNLVLVVFGGYLIYLSEFDVSELNFSFLFGMGIIFLIFYSWKLFENFRKFFFKKKGIILNNQGIELDGIFFPWNEINNIRIIEKEAIDSKYRYDEKFLSFKHKTKLYEEKLENYNIHDFKLEKLIEIYRKRQPSNKNFENKNSDLESILTYDEYLDLDYETHNKELEKIREIVEKNSEKLERYLKTLEISRDGQLPLIYNALSEDFPKWEKILSLEFIRLFETAKRTADNATIFDVINEIIPDEIIHSQHVTKIVNYLFSELENPNDKIRYHAIWSTSIWVDSDNYLEFPEIMNRLKSKLQDNNWKIRWITNNVLKEFPNFQENKLGLLDKLRGKFGNPYSI